MPISAWLALAALSAPHPTLAWQAPDECPDTAAVLAMTTSLQQQRSPLLVDLEPPAAHGVVTRASSGAWVLQLELHDHRGTRERRLQADECGLLARAAALVIAIHLDARTRDAAALREPTSPAAPPPPGSPLTPAPPPPEPPALEPPPLEPPRSPSAPPRVLRPPLPVNPPHPLASVIVIDELEPPRPPEPPPEPPATPRLAGHLRAEGGLDIGLLPGVGGSVGLAGGPAIRGVRIEAGVLAVPRRFTFSETGKYHGRLDRLAATLRVCPGGTLRRGALALHGCLGGEAGAIRAVADRGVETPNPQWAPWFGLLLGPALRLRLAGPVGLWLAVEGTIALNRPTFTVGPDGDTLHHVSRLGLRIHLGLDLQFVARKR